MTPELSEPFPASLGRRPEVAKTKYPSRRLRHILRAMEVSEVRGKSSEDRGFLQERIALFGRSLFLLFASVPLLGVGVLELHDPGFTRRIHGPPYALFAVFALGAVWLFCRRGVHSLITLTLVDGAATISAGAAIATITIQAPPEVPVGVPSTLLLTYLLVARAIVVPSEPRKTAWISALAALPAIVVMVAFGTIEHVPAPHTVIVLPIWCVMAVGLSTWTSHVVYRLRRSAREAQKLGQYTLETQIGEGGMGVVYRARHSMLRRPTVIKLLPPEKAGQGNLARFEREVQLTSQLSSPNTVAIYDFGRTDEGVFYYAMEYLDGIDLEQLVAASGPLPAARVIHVLVQVCSALIEAHEAGLIHRDVKPGNVMLCRHGGVHDVVKVLDFGLVKDLSGGSETTVTHTESVLGTPLYISPEAIAEPHRVGPRSDLYAVGALGFHLLTGRNVFPGRTVAEVYARHLYSQPERPSEQVAGVPADLEQLILSCLEKAPEQRPASARVLRSALLACGAAGRWSEDDARAFWQTHGGDDKKRSRLEHAVTLEAPRSAHRL